MSQAICIGGVCFNCRKFGIFSRMLVMETGYLCETCKTFRASKMERFGRSGVMDVLRMGGFVLLLITTVLYASFPAYAQTLMMWLGLEAAFSFYLLSFMTRTRELLH